MTKKYKRKRFLEENATDNSPSLKKVNFEKSNRQEAKKEIRQEIIKVNNEDFDQIMREIENPSEPNDELRRLLKNKPTDN